MIPSHYTFPSKKNKGNYSKNTNGDVFFNGYSIISKYQRVLNINEKINYKSILINL